MNKMKAIIKQFFLHGVGYRLIPTFFFILIIDLISIFLALVLLDKF